MTFSCKYCNSCKQHGRQKSTRYGMGKKHYWCEHERVKEVTNWNFIGFGTNTYESPLVVKTSPRWCPKKKFKEL